MPGLTEISAPPTDNDSARIAVTAHSLRAFDDAGDTVACGLAEVTSGNPVPAPRLRVHEYGRCRNRLDRATTPMPPNARLVPPP